MVKEICQKSTQKTTPITPEFTDACLTNFAGVVPFSDFLLKKLDFRQALAEHLDLGMGANCQYKDWQIAGLIVCGYLCGYRRLAHFEQLSRDSTVQKLLGLEEAPIQIHRLYGDRGECENWIEAVKNQPGAGTTLTGQFWANDLLWQLGVLAYNLSIWLRRLTDRASWRAEPRTFREWFIRCAGKLVCHARRWTLNMQSTYHERSRWENIYQKLCQLQL